jgi:hypothetical protein
MSGASDKKTNEVSLSPAIWIRCGSKRCCEHIKAAVADLTYLSRYEIHVRLDAPRYAWTCLGPRKLGPRRLHGAAAARLTSEEYTQTAMTDGPRFFTCGYKATFSIYNRAQLTRVACTIGGLLHSNGSLYALTTAHSLFEAPDNYKELLRYSASKRSLTISQDPRSKSVSTNDNLL